MSKHSVSSSALIFGVAPIVEALRAGRRPIERITIAEGVNAHRLREIYELARAANVPVRRAARQEIEKLAAGANHQSVVAHVAAARYADADELLEDLTKRARIDSSDEKDVTENALALILDGIEDPRNLGAILRTAECAGVQAVFVPERRAVGLTETVAKASAGAVEHVQIARVGNIARLVDDLKERGVWTVGAEASGEKIYTDWDWTLPCALVMGGEGEGLRRLVRERCDALVKIPLRGRITSLNVSVAAGILLYEIVRQRIARKK
jgi:23S rRNA (guanosine2251-2'-O)-methyltransferase